MYGGNGAAPPVPHLQGFARTGDLSGVRLGVFQPWFDDADPPIVRACDRALQFLVGLGAEVVPVAIPHLRSLSIAHGIKIASEFAAAHGLQYWRHDASLAGRELEAGSRWVAETEHTSHSFEALCGTQSSGFGAEPRGKMSVAVPGYAKTFLVSDVAFDRRFYISSSWFN